MSNKEHQSLMDQVWAFTRILTITGGLAMFSFVIAGYVWMTSPGLVLSSVVENNENLVVNEIAVEEESAKEILSNQKVEKSGAESNNNHSKIELAGFSDSDNVIERKPAADQKSASSKKSEVFVEGDMFENFRTTCQNDLVNITWTTDGTDDESFELEISSDSVNFKVLDDSPALTEVVNHKNVFRLTLPVNEAETKFFRLRRAFPDNAFMYSEAVKVTCSPNPKSEAIIDVYPSGNGSYRVVIDSKINDHYSIVMTDMNEMELVTDEFDVLKGINQLTFKSGVMPRGNYNLNVSNGTTVIQKKVAIK